MNNDYYLKSEAVEALVEAKRLLRAFARPSEVPGVKRGIEQCTSVVNKLNRSMRVRVPSAATETIS